MIDRLAPRPPSACNVEHGGARRGRLGEEISPRREVSQP